MRASFPNLTQCTCGVYIRDAGNALRLIGLCAGCGEWNVVNFE
jgi:hypothetical protein